MILSKIKNNTTEAIRRQLIGELASAGNEYTEALNAEATCRARELAEAAITYLGDYVARDLHYAANAADQWLITYGATLDTWEVAEHAAARSLGDYYANTY